MKFVDIENIWTVDMTLLSNADRGRVYFERAKIVTSEALADPAKRALAVEGTKFRRSYLVEKIGCQPAAMNQNPRIKELLSDCDERLQNEAGYSGDQQKRPIPCSQSPEVKELRAIIDGLRRDLEIRAAEIADLKAKLREARWVDAEVIDHGRLPW